jgi:hypothetical protein
MSPSSSLAVGIGRPAFATGRVKVAYLSTTWGFDDKLTEHRVVSLIWKAWQVPTLTPCKFQMWSADDDCRRWPNGS